jgi:hypothetical protein
MLGVLGLLMASVGFSASASLISSDYEGAGLGGATLDTNSGLEWLSLSYTDGKSFNQSLEMIANGGSLEGWRLPTYQEYLDLIVVNMEVEESAVESRYFNITADNNIKWVDAFGMTHDDRSAGYFTRTDGLISISGGYKSNSFFGTVHGSYSKSVAYAHYGTYLVSDGDLTYSSINSPGFNNNGAVNVAEPTSIALLGL